MRFNEFQLDLISKSLYFANSRLGMPKLNSGKFEPQARWLQVGINIELKKIRGEVELSDFPDLHLSEQNLTTMIPREFEDVDPLEVILAHMEYLWSKDYGYTKEDIRNLFELIKDLQESPALVINHAKTMGWWPRRDVDAR